MRSGHLPVLTRIPSCKIVLVKNKIQRRKREQGRELTGVLEVHLDFLKKNDRASLRNEVAGRVTGALQSQGADRVPAENNTEALCNTRTAKSEKEKHLSLH